MNYFNNINLNQNELQKAVMHPLAQAPANAKAGQMYYNTTDKKLYYYDGTNWVGLNDVDLTDYAKKTDVGDATITVNVNGHTDAFTTNQKTAKTLMFTVAKSDVGLGNVDNTSDADKPVSTAQQKAIDDAVAGLEKTANKTTTISSTSTDTQYPSAKATYTYGQNILTSAKSYTDTATANVEKTTNKKTSIVGAGNNTDYPTTKAVVDYVAENTVKDVTLDGTSIVENGIVALESTYHIDLTGENGTLTQVQYDGLNGDDASYIWYKQDDNSNPAKLIKTGTEDGLLIYQAIFGEALVLLGVNADKTWTAEVQSVQLAYEKVTAIDSSSTDLQYPSAKAVYVYAAKKDHASSSYEYGLGTTDLYGHVKIRAGDLGGGILPGYEDGVAAAAAHTHSQYMLLDSSKAQTITGDIIVGGNLTVNGTTTTIESTTLTVKDKLIEVASGNTTKLTTPAGLVVPKYDGTNNGALVFDGDGIAYVGDVTLNTNGDIDVANSSLVALAGRAKTIANDNLVKWDNTNQIFVDTGIAASDIAKASDIPTNYVTIDTEQSISGGKHFTKDITVGSSDSSGSYTTGYSTVLSTNYLNFGLAGYTAKIDAAIGASSPSSRTFTLPQKSGTIALLSDIPTSPTNMVTTDGNQNITGVKTFDANVILNSTLQAGDSVGTVGQVLVSQGAGKTPIWSTLSLPQGTVKKFAWSIAGNGTTTTFESNNELATAECTVSVYLQVSGATWELVMTDVVVTAAKIQIIFGQAPTSEQSFRVVVTG